MGPFDLGLHGKLADVNSMFGLGELMIEKPEVVMASEAKTAAESALKLTRFETDYYTIANFI